MKICVGDVKKIVFGFEFRKNWPTYVHTVHKCANEFLPAISLFFQ